MATTIANSARGITMVAKEVARATLDRTLPGGGAVPRRASEVTPAWLEDVLGLTSGSIRGVDVLDEHSGTAARARIAIEAAPGADVPRHLFVKFNPSSFSQQLMMNLFDLGRREVLAYQTLGANPPIRVPHCYASRLDDRRGRSVMVFEDLTETATFRNVLDSVTDVEAAAVVDAMADQHIAFWQSPALAALAGRSQAANLLGDVIRRRLIGNMRGHTSDLVPAEVKRQARIVFERSADIDAFWAAQPQTLIHGDPHLGNLFFEGTRVGFLDWQVTTSGAGIRDVAYFASVSVEPDQLRKIERGLVERYAARLDAAGLPADLDDLWNLYRAGMTEMYISAVAAAEAGERAQALDITYSGVLRNTAAVVAHDSFGVLEALLDRRRV